MTMSDIAPTESMAEEVSGMLWSSGSRANMKVVHRHVIGYEVQDRDRDQSGRQDQ